VTFTSSDPSKVRIAPAWNQHGQTSLTVNYTTPGYPAWLEILDTGDVSITASSPGMEPVTVPVSLGDITATLVYPYSTSPLLNLQLAPGQAVPLALRLFVFPDDSPSYLQDPRFLRPDVPDLQVSVLSSNPGVLNLNNVSFATRALSTITFQNLSVASPGTAVLSIKATPQLRAPGTLTVQVDAPGIKMAPASVGKNLITNLGVSVVGLTPGTAFPPIKVTSSDPSRVLLSTDLQTAGQASVTLSSNAVFVHGLADSGTVDITASADGFGTAKTTATLNPSGFAWSPQAWMTPYPYSTLGPILVAYMLDPVTLAPLTQQNVRPGLGGSVTVQVADPGVATVSPASVPLSSYTNYSREEFAFAPVSGGDTSVAIVQPPGFVQPAGQGALRLKALSPLLRSTWADPGRSMQAPMVVQSNVPSNPPITVTSSDPTRLLVSLNNAFLGSASVTSNYRNGAYTTVYLQALDGPADVPVTLSCDGLKDAKVVVQIFPSSITLQTPYYPNDTFRTNTQQDSVTLTATVSALGAQNPGPYGYQSTLRPGLDPIPLNVTSSNSSVAAVPKPPILNSLTSQTNVSVKPVGPGVTDLSIVPPLGYVSPSTGKTVHLTVDGPSFFMSDLTIGQDLQAQVVLQVQNGAGTIPNDVDVTLTSGDASRLLLSAGATAVGSGSLTIHFLRGDPSSRPIYVQALGNGGQVAVSISAPGYGSTTTTIKLAPLAFTVDQTRLTLVNSATLHVTPVASLPYPYVSNPRIRPGFAGLAMSITSSDTNVATVSPQVLTWTAGASDLTFNVQAAGGGTAQLNFSVPDPYIAPSGVTVSVASANLNVPSSMLLGKDLVGRVGIFGDNFAQNSVKITVTTGDSSRVLVSSSSSAPGQPTVDVSSAPGQQAVLWVHAFAGSGSVQLTFTAPGYKSAQMTVQLTQPEVTLRPQSAIGTLTPLSPGVVFLAQLQTTPPSNSTNSSGTAVLRPGAAPVQVPINLTDVTVGTVTPASLTFNPGDSTLSFTFQATAQGSTLLTLGVPTGFTDPVAQGQQLLTVVQARASFSATASTGKDLVRQTSLTLGAPAGQNLSITLTSGDPTRLLLGTTANPAGGSSVTVTVSAGNSTSSAFSLIGLGGSGSVPVAISAPLSPSSINVALQPSGFVIGQASSPVPTNSISSLLLNATTLSPGSLAPDTSLPLRPGIAPVSVILTSSDQSVILSPAAVQFNAGDQQQRATIISKAAGTATLTIQQPAGFSTPSSGTNTVITVR
jgi:hypothetical protein